MNTGEGWEGMAEMAGPAPLAEASSCYGLLLEQEATKKGRVKDGRWKR